MYQRNQDDDDSSNQDDDRGSLQLGSGGQSDVSNDIDTSNLLPAEPTKDDFEDDKGFVEIDGAIRVDENAGNDPLDELHELGEQLLQEANQDVLQDEPQYGWRSDISEAVVSKELVTYNHNQ